MTTEAVNSLATDGDYIGTKINSGSITLNVSGGRLGVYAAGKNTNDTAYFGVFELSAPVGAVFESIKMHFKGNGAGSNNTYDLDLGFLVPDGIWDAPGGLGNYASKATLPWSEANQGVYVDDTVWQGGAPLNFPTHTSSNIQYVNQSFGEETDEKYTVPGLLAMFQAFWDANAGADGGACCFHIHHPWHNFTAHDQGTILESANPAENRPLLTVEYSVPGGKATATPEVAALASSRNSVEPLASATPSVGSRAAGRPEASPLVSAKVDVDSRAAARASVD